MTLQEIAAHYPGGKWFANGAKYETHCVCHDDRKSSLGIARGTNGGVVIYCQAGCDTADVLAAKGLSLADLAPPGENGSRPKFEASYRYDDANGNLIATKHRKWNKEGFLWQNADGGWSTRGMTLPLFGLPLLLTAPEEGVIWIAEGEKDVLTLRKWGLVATTNPGGAAKEGSSSKWHLGFTAWLKENKPQAQYAVLRDEDEAGHAHAASVVRSLQAAGLTVRQIILPGLEYREKHGLDVTDWKAAGHTGDELQSLVNAAFQQQADDPAGEAQEWEKLIDLFQPPLPSFPLDSLPFWARAQVEAVSIFTQTPTDLAAMLFLAVLALAVQKRVEAAPKPGWVEQLCLWVFVALASGNVKSGVFRHLVDPVSDYEYKSALAKREVIAAEVQDREIKEARLKHLRDKAAKESDLFKRQEAADEAAGLAKELAKLQITAAPRFLADDATPEKVAMLMAEQGGRIAIMSPDTDAFAIMGGRYSGDGQANFTVYLKAHSGDDIRVDRVHRAPVVIRRPALTMGLLAQPSVLTRLSEKPEFRERGLLARFFIIVPTSWVGRREIDPNPIAIDVRAQYGEQIKRLLDMKGVEDEDGNVSPHRLEFTPAASLALSEFRTRLEPRLGEGGDLEYLADWGSKLGGGLVRIAALLHLGEMSDQEEPWSEPVDATNVQAAEEIVEYLIAHARAAFRLIGSDPSLDGARKIVRWLKRHNQPCVSRRDIHNGLQWTFKTVEEVDRPLALLVDHHYLRPEETERSPSRGRPASPVFEVNPEVLRQ